MHEYRVTVAFQGKFGVGIQAPDEASARELAKNVPVPSTLAIWCDVGDFEAVNVKELAPGERIKDPEEMLDDARHLDFLAREAERKEDNERILATIQEMGPNYTCEEVAAKTGERLKYIEYIAPKCDAEILRRMS